MGFSGKQTLVTGAAGLVGSNLVSALVARGAKVRATIHRKPPPTPLEGVDYVAGDLRDPAHCMRLAEGCEVIFHCAAHGSSAVGFNRGGGLEFLDNYDMDARLLAAAQSARVARFVWLGSTTAYPEGGERAMTEDELFAGEPFGKHFTAAWSKRFTEVVCRIYAERATPPLPVAVLRPTSIYGPGDDFDPVTAHVVPALIRKVVERMAPLEVWGTGEEQRDLVFVGDVVEAALLAAEKVTTYGAFNIGAGRSVTIRELIETLVRLDGYADAQLRFDAGKPTTIPIRRISIDRAATELGWQPQTSLEAGLRQTIEWFRQQTAAK